MATPAAVAPPTTAPAAARRERLISVDLLRGGVMVIMALDHVRDYFTELRIDPTDLSQASTALFLTRWITHFCAPVFVFLAGTGAFLGVAAGKPIAEVRRFLWTRGLWLVFIEVTVVRFAWFWNLDYRMVALQVIWVLGLSMIILSVMTRFPVRVVGAVGVLMIVAHNAFDGIQPHTQEFFLIGASGRDWLVSFLHAQRLPFLYPLIPWPGVMMAGYAFGTLLAGEAAERRRRLTVLGLALVALFVGLRASGLYGDPLPWQRFGDDRTVLSFLNTQKYPPSLLYLLMTLGPAIALLPRLEGMTGAVGRFFVTFGRVPFFYYVIHLYLIHALVLAVAALQGRPLAPFFQIFAAFPADWGFGLPVIYALWALTIAFLYPACRWFERVKRTRREWWLSYL